MTFQKFTGYAPDYDANTPGVITEISDFYPTQKGYGAAPSNVPSGYDPLASACIGAALLQKLDATNVLYAGTASALYKAGSIPSWTDVSKVGGYTAGSDQRWSFAIFGDTSLAALKSETLQYATTGSFADVAGAPKARHVETVPGFVILADTNEGTYGDQSDRWWCSGFEDYTDWTPSTSTQCTTGRLISSPGPIKAWKRLGSDIVAYKEKGIHVGKYVGVPDVFDFELVPGDVGCPSGEGVISTGDAHFFVGYEDFYLFNGTLPVSIGKPVKKTFFADLNKTYRYKILGFHDRANSLVMWFYPSGNSTTNNKVIIYNYKTDQWGAMSRTAEAVVENLQGQITYANVDDYFATYGDLNLTYDSPFWAQKYSVPAIFDTSHIMQTVTGTPGTCSMTSGDIGDDELFTLLNRVRPRFSTAPTSATMVNFYRDQSGTPYTQDQTTTLANGCFDVMRSSRWHKTTISTVGVAELSGNFYDLKPEGTE